MVDKNGYLFLKQFLDEYPISGWIKSLESGRILNVGSADYGTGTLYRDLFKEKEILGVDIVEGDGVDLICDMEGDCQNLNGERFAMALCCSVLEHCQRPWLVAKNIENHLLPFGLLYVTVPWVWRTHDYPKDYWRISVEGIRSLFPNVLWKRIAHSTQNKGEFMKHGADHDDKPPWRVIFRGRAHIVVHQVHMIGRMS